MADFSTLKTTIRNTIKTNGQQEISGNVLQNILNTIVTSIEDSFNVLTELPTITTETLPNGVRIILTQGENVQTFDILNGEVLDAPSDNKQYVRKNGGWEAVGEAIDAILRSLLEYDAQNKDEVVFTNANNTKPYAMTAGVAYHIKASSEQTFSNLSLICIYDNDTWALMTNTRYTDTTLEFDFTPSRPVVSIGTNYVYQPSATTWSVKYEIDSPDIVRIKEIEETIQDFAPAKEALDDLVIKSKVTPDSYINDAYYDENQHAVLSNNTTTGYKLAVYNVGGGQRIGYKAANAIANYNYVTVVDALGNELQHVFGNYQDDKEGELTLHKDASAVYLQIGKPNGDESNYGMFQAFADTLLISEHKTEDDAYVHVMDEHIIGSATNNDGYAFMSEEIPAFLVIGQSNADGRIESSAFPSSINYNGETIPTSKVIPTCMFHYGTLSGYTESAYTGHTNWASFEYRDNTYIENIRQGLWAFDDIMYNMLAKNYGGKPFYVVKCTMGATGLQNPKLQPTMGIYSWNAHLSDFGTKQTGKDGSMAMVTKLNCKRAFELVPKLAFKAIFMHQGENDCVRLTNRKKGTYFADLADLIDFCRAAIHNQDCPFIFGSVPPNSRDYDAMIYHDQQMVAEKLHKCHLVTMPAASGWVNDGMNVHFLAPDAIGLAKDMYDVLVENNYL